MLESIEELHGATSTSDLADRFGRLLGLDGPVPLRVARRAVVDDLFTFHLIASRGDHALLQKLLDDPKNQRYEPELHAAEVAPASTRSNFDLLWTAGKAFARWSATRFAIVDPATHEARFGACLRCEHLVEPPSRRLYHLVAGQADGDGRVCDACGCVAARKAWLASEQCPVEDTAHTGFNRWGQPMRRRPP